MFGESPGGLGKPMLGFIISATDLCQPPGITGSKLYIWLYGRQPWQLYHNANDNGR
jgi:hypothetical protein